MQHCATGLNRHSSCLQRCREAIISARAPPPPSLQLAEGWLDQAADNAQQAVGVGNITHLQMLLQCLRFMRAGPRSGERAAGAHQALESQQHLHRRNAARLHRPLGDVSSLLQPVPPSQLGVAATNRCAWSASRQVQKEGHVPAAALHQLRGTRLQPQGLGGGQARRSPARGRQLAATRAKGGDARLREGMRHGPPGARGRGAWCEHSSTMHLGS